MKKTTRVYKTANNCPIEADIYDRGEGTPVIIYMHSGALIFGTRNWLSGEQITYLTDAGFSIVNIDYRLAPETKFEDIIEDMKDAIRWVRTEASQWYGFDTSRIALMGASAGGYLSLLAGTMDDIMPNAIISLYGYGDLFGEWYTEPSDHYCKSAIVGKEAAYRCVGEQALTNGDWSRFNYYLYCRQHGKWLEEVSGMDLAVARTKLSCYNPIDRMTAGFPPALLLHGDQDTDVPYEQSVLVFEKLKTLGVQTELIAIEGADHVFDQHFRTSAVQNAYRRIVDFLNEHLNQ
ncbi:alpha/beta hydrolase [Paenibacillus sp. NEAU-GSW1]|uniref:alpha/beta hydrolase n=1 Tax=Paenibacillus sp. NEAU-GSW1 TaxID=2682486 RepID=UPI0012E265BC|nr:alpha/beta hydrolase [Paenibacillus sp. NEAU-GSW1]MUT65190.1 alpha/beta hydrolase fold domain-containing protein [Paenibacillus sp. NEAU-GSW1]